MSSLADSLIGSIFTTVDFFFSHGGVDHWAGIRCRWDGMDGWRGNFEVGRFALASTAHPALSIVCKWHTRKTTYMGTLALWAVEVLSSYIGTASEELWRFGTADKHRYTHREQERDLSMQVIRTWRVCVRAPGFTPLYRLSHTLSVLSRHRWGGQGTHAVPSVMEYVYILQHMGQPWPTYMGSSQD